MPINTPTRDPGEALAYAAGYLEKTGLDVLDRNWQCAEGEIGIVAEERGTLVVCKVRTSQRKGSRLPAEAVSRATISRLRRLAVRWMNAHGKRFDRVRVDVIALTEDGPAGFTLEHVQAVG